MSYLLPSLYDTGGVIFGSLGRYLSTDPVLVSDYELLIHAPSLDTFSAPFLLFATTAKGKSALLYQVAFDGPAPEFPDFFEIAPHGTLRIPFIPLRNLQRLGNCIPIPSNDWASCSLRCHAVAAFYRLSLLPSVSLSIFKRADLFDQICEQFYSDYHVLPPIESALAYVFSELVFCLRLFGFSIPSTPAETHSLQCAQHRADAFDGVVPRPPDHHRFFGFSELKWAIARFNPESRANPEILDVRAWMHLQDTKEFLKRVCLKFEHLREDLPPREAIIDGVDFLQAMHRLPRDGVCDARTLRFILDSSLTNDCELGTICRLAEIPMEYPRPPIVTTTLGRLSVADLGPAEPVQAAVNAILERVPDGAGVGKWLMEELQKGVKAQFEAFRRTGDGAREMRERLAVVQRSLEMSKRQNDQAASKFNATVQRLADMRDRHADMQAGLEVARQRVNEERRGNEVLLIIVVVLGAVLAITIAI
jgi:hypothetical protein